MRLDKMLSECGLLSRKETAAFAKKGLITVNGEPEKRPDRHIDPLRDAVTLNGEPVIYMPFQYVMLNKPAGYISATEDGNYPVVTELLPEKLRRMNLFPCGRLDRDTVGLMLLMNDGPLAHRLLSPRHHVEKTYFFRCLTPLSDEAEKRMTEGMTLGDEMLKPAALVLSEDRLSGHITLTEGKYHQIKRMFGACDNRITYLRRESFGGIPLDPALPEGTWRYLTENELVILKNQK